MKRIFIIFSLCFALPTWAADTDAKAIKETLMNYIEGSSYSQPEKIKSAFHDKATLFLSKDGQPVWKMTPQKYASWFSKNKGQFTGRIGNVISIDIEGQIATAKAEILLPKKNIRYIDMFLVKKIDGKWVIISKTADKMKSNAKGKKILFIVSNKDTHGKLDRSAGASYSEIVKAYDVFKKAGYTVDFVSPFGGSIPLSYVTTGDDLHRSHLYNADFMYALANTYRPDQISAGDYAAVHYIGGSNAMYDVPENKAIQKIAMSVYEDFGGIISSVCHGTAGIAHLKTKDGRYLVDGKRISGYPEDYEKQDAAYFKEFPFLIRKTIEKRGGAFFYSAPNTPHVEVDGRIVTGQNHLSSAPVAQKMIEILEKKQK